jgi:diguanylate cyclase (GGDEF)-like protein
MTDRTPAHQENINADPRPASEPMSTAQPHLPGPPNPSVPPRALVVEDDPDQCDLICEALRLHRDGDDGARIVGVHTAKACLEQNLGDFDIVLLDYNLPDMDGLDLLDRVLRRCDLPVIFVTGENLPTTAAEAIRRGAQDYVVKLGDYLFALPVLVEKNVRQHWLKRENTRLQDQLTASLEEIRVKNLQLEESLQKLRTMAATDHLTGLANRRAFAETLTRCVEEATRYGFDLACLMCDLDHYKALNDSLGHQVGDQILVQAAEVILANLRSSDTAARYGGDEFVLLLPHTSVEMALNVGERIRQGLILTTRQGTPASGGVTLSMGIASLKSDRPASADALVAMADRAMYVAKDCGRNRIVTFGEIGALQPTQP